jgi:hypothetical protein
VEEERHSKRGQLLILDGDERRWLSLK